ncbi:MAG TPA: pyridoxamine 5'-phosphate oxidase family protein [Actinomycetota bacterium]|nr:pyridoxamine 5'-phosphate oxidase family protein [Actinomycetota bacterium]
MGSLPLAGEDLEAFLEEAHLAHFATTGPDGRPRVRPVWFRYADGAFWFTTRLEARRTGADVADGSAVAVSIASERRPYLAVIAYGVPTVWEADVSGWLERIATRYGEAEGRRWLAGAMKERDRVVLRLVPDKVIAWHYGKGDYARMQRKESLRVRLPDADRP